MKILLKAKAGLYDSAAWLLSKASKIVPPPVEPQERIKEIISYHGFATSGSGSFSCFIPNSGEDNSEGLLLWTFFPHRGRVETQIQKNSTDKKIQRVSELTELPQEECRDRIFDITREYLITLEKTGLFKPIGGGVSLFGKPTLFNLAAEEELFSEIKNLEKLEYATVNNAVVNFSEETGYFNLKNKDSLLL